MCKVSIFISKITAATSVLSSPSTSTTALDGGAHLPELVAAALAVLGVDLADAPTVSGSNPAPSVGARIGRQAEAVDAAIELFFERGYSAVTIDDIGAALGMAGPSLYHHFATKADILAAGFDRATSRLAAGRRRRADFPGPPALDRLIGSHVRFCLRNRSLIGVYVSEMTNLPDGEQRAVVEAIREGTEEWVASLLAEAPWLATETARVRVQAALATIHDIARVGSLHLRPRIADELDVIVRAVLGTSHRR